MSLTTAFLVLSNLIVMIHSDCSEFERQWQTCPPELYPVTPIDNNTSCTYKIDSSAKVVIDDNEGKVSVVYCYNNTFPDSVFDCLPIKNSKHFVLTDCPFPQIAFDKFFSNSNLNELTLRYQNTSILQTSLHIKNLPRIQFLSVKNFHTFAYFELILNSVPLMKSIKISNFTFTNLPTKPFQDLSLLKGLSLTKGVLETLPDDFLYGTSLQMLDLSFNKLKNFQPNLILNMKELKKLNLSYNLLESIDGNLFRDAIALETISLDHNRISSLPSELFRTTPNIKTLSINHNELREIPNNIFRRLRKVRILSLSHNQLTMLPADVFRDMTLLMVLELQSNQLHFIPEKLFALQKWLYQIDLSKNKISRFSSSAPFGSNKYLAKVNISGNNLEEFLNLNWSLYNISQLDLSDNLISQIIIPISASPGGFIFLRRNQIRNVTIRTNLSSDYQYLLEGNPFDCSCYLSDFLSALSIIADVKKLVCQEPWYQAGKYIGEFENEKELCEIYYECPLNCKCHLLHNDKIEVDCSNKGMKSAAISLPIQTTILHFENNKISSLYDVNDDIWVNITHLYLTNNSLTSLQNWTVPASLQLLAIDSNKLVKLPSLLMERISKSENFWIYLKENNWPCDCQTIPLKMWLMENLSKVKDSSFIYCKPYNNYKFVSSIVNSSLERFVCSDSQPLNKLPNNCAQSEIYISVSIIFYFMLHFVHKIYC